MNFIKVLFKSVQAKRGINARNPSISDIDGNECTSFSGGWSDTPRAGPSGPYDIAMPMGTVLEKKQRQSTSQILGICSVRSHCDLSN